MNHTFNLTSNIFINHILNKISNNPLYSFSIFFFPFFFVLHSYNLSTNKIILEDKKKSIIFLTYSLYNFLKFHYTIKQFYRRILSV